MINPNAPQGNQMGLPGDNTVPENQMGQDPMSMLKNNPQALAYIQSLAPEDQDAYMNKLFQDYKGQGSIIDEQLNQADQMIGTATPEGIQTKNAGFVASNPLSHIATAAQRIRGNMNKREALAKKQELSDSSTTARTLLGKSILSDKAKAEMRQNRRGDIDPESLGDELQDSTYRTS